MWSTELKSAYFHSPEVRKVSPASVLPKDMQDEGCWLRLRLPFICLDTQRKGKPLIGHLVFCLHVKKHVEVTKYLNVWCPIDSICI